MHEQKIIKKYKITPSPRMLKAVKIMQENGGNKSRAMLEAGFAPSYAKNPKKLIESDAYKDWLKASGLSAEYWVRRHKRLSTASTIEVETFDHVKKGRKWIKYTDEQIRSAIEGTDEDPTGCILMYIKEGQRCRIARFRVPDNNAQARALDFALKTRGDYTADKAFEDLANHVIGKEEEEEIDLILKKNSR